MEKKKIYVLTYSSYSHEDHDLYSETIGIFLTEESAREKMKQDIEFSLVEDNDETMNDWNIETTHAEFDNDYYSKRYKIDYCYLDK